MRTCVAIRTHRWTEEEQRIYEALHPVLGDDFCAVVHNPKPGFEAPIDVIPMTDAWVERRGLRLIEDYGWRCGDYAYYCLRAGKPDYDFYWLVEPDLFFSGDPAGFFSAFEGVETDVLGLDIRPYDPNHRWAQGMPQGMKLIAAIFALTRFSGRALDKLVELRVANSSPEIFKRKYPNDELFSFSFAHADPELTLGNLREHAPSWFEGTTFETDPDMLYDALVHRALPGKVYHPVRSKDGVIGALAGRIAQRFNYVHKLTDTLGHYSDEELEQVADELREILIDRLKTASRRGRRALRQQKAAE